MCKEELVELTLPYPGGREKNVRVFVPEHKEKEKLPVIYMTDGQNLFDEDVFSFGCWYTREAVAAERERSGKAAIIVGIHNDGPPMERTNELTPKSIGAFSVPSDVPEELKASFDPQGEDFDAFVLNSVMPAVEARFPVKKGRMNTAFCGSSSGGLMAFYIVIKHSELFSAAGAFSPALMLYDRNDLERWIEETVHRELPYLYLYAGGSDELEKEIRRSTDAVAAFLEDFYPPELLRVVYKLDQPHHESAWEVEFKEFLHSFLTRR